MKSQTAILCCTHRAWRTPNRRGMLLVIVLVAIAMLSLAAFTFAELMLSEQQAARVEGRKAQAQAIVQSAAEMLRLYLAQSSDALTQAGGTYDNTAQFANVQVVDDGTTAGSGRFSIIAARIESGQVTGTRFGLENESAKLNINAVAAIEKNSPGAGKALLMALPGMDTNISDAILDWLDADDTPRENGAESDYYSGLSPPYAAKNGPLDTIEELLSVKGVTPQLLFGADANRNGLIDANEQGLPQIADQNSADPEMNRGWAAYLTLYSKESNLQSDGTARINLNSDDLQKLHDDLAGILTAEQANFIVAYRLYGPYQQTTSRSNQSAIPRKSVFHLVYYQAPQTPPATPPSNPSTPQQQQGGSGNGGGNNGASNGSEGSGGSGQSGSNNSKPVAADSVTLDLTQKPKTKINSILDLIGVEVRYTEKPQQGQSSGSGSGSSGQQPKVITLKAAFPDDVSAAANYLPKLQDSTTANTATTIPGRININQAPRTLLMAIPGMTSEAADQIMSNRQPDAAADTDPDQKYATWPYTKGIVKLAQMKKLMPFVTAGGSVYRAQIVGYFDAEGPAARAEAIIDASDTSTGAARILFWRDTSHLGRGFSLGTLQTGSR